MRAPEDCIEETVPPCNIVGGSRRSVTFPHGRVGGSFPPIGKQFVQLDSFRTGRRHRHVQGEAYGRDRRARGNCSGNIECDYAAAKLTHAVLAGEEVKTSAIAVVALSGIVLV